MACPSLHQSLQGAMLLCWRLRPKVTDSAENANLPEPATFVALGFLREAKVVDSTQTLLHGHGGALEKEKGKNKTGYSARQCVADMGRDLLLRSQAKSAKQPPVGSSSRVPCVSDLA